MGPGLPLGMLQPLSAVLQIGFAIWLIVRYQDQREDFRRRALLLGLALLAAVLFFSWYGMSAHPEFTANGTPQLAGQFLLFTLLLGYCVGSVLLLYDVPLHHALFCCAMGYTMQNLVSGLEGLIVLLGGRLAGLGEGMVAFRVLSGLGAVVAVYLPCYLLLVRAVERAGTVQVEDRATVGVFVMVILVVILFDVNNKALSYGPTPLPLLVSLRIIHGAVCVFVLFAQYEMLFAQHLRSEAAATERLMAEQQRQYELSRDNIEAINIKCHDIRHQIRHLGETGTAVDAAVLADIAREVSVYDATVRTGNEALDTILTEKRLLCEGEGITLTCMADGHALDFLAPSELYALFGNALDNAIEATRQVPEGGRSISLGVRRVGDMVSIHVENTCVGQASFADGLPQTTKLTGDGTRDTTNHGIGTRSMRALAERYDGIFSAAQRGDVFCLDITLPLPE
ncbi:MAG: sensor histidine kinase [Atopobiaceae bacterium]|nr:sensor histidine kinase [Atopobiaceae bacterium]